MLRSHTRHHPVLLFRFMRTGRASVCTAFIRMCTSRRPAVLGVNIGG
ncbi:hypothetical protein SEA_TOLLS_60 [Gordonia phage Tolls]|nr:hypothetical protein SEA_TOLLS_60 [Gordonia phage Tolls]